MIRDRLLCCAFALFLAVLLTSLPLFAQKITGDISGTVQDSTGAVVKDATITAKNIGTGETRSAKSSDAGFYRIVELPPGKYTVTVRSEEHTSELQSRLHLVCRLLLEKKKK